MFSDVAFCRLLCYTVSMVPNEPAMLLSYINMKLRDQYDSLDELCDDLDLDRDEIESRLASIGAFYDADHNCFR